MFQTFHNKIVALLTGLALIAIPVVLPAVAHAAPAAGVDINNCLAQGSGFSVDSGASCANPGTAGGTTKINTLITDVVNIFSAVVGVISVIMIIVGGFQYITSGGDTGKVGTAKTTIIYAIVGLVVVAFSQFLVQFVLNKVAGTT
jgi:hypothetical protein